MSIQEDGKISRTLGYVYTYTCLNAYFISLPSIHKKFVRIKFIRMVHNKAFLIK